MVALATALALIALPAGLIVVQPDLGTAVLVVGSGLFVIFLAGISWWWIAGIALTGAASLPIVWQFMRDYQKNRVYQFLSPDSDPLGSGWQTIQSKIAVGSGGWSGKGWTHGTQSQLEFLPERHTDFGSPVFSEELGPDWGHPADADRRLRGRPRLVDRRERPQQPRPIARRRDRDDLLRLHPGQQRDDHRNDAGQGRTAAR